MTDRSIAPEHSLSPHIIFPKVQSHSMENGIPVHVLSTGTQPVLKIEVLFPRGGAYYESNAGAAFIALKMLKEGTASFTSSQLSSFMAQYGAFIDISPSFDMPSVGLYCLTKHFDILMPAFAEMINAPTFSLDDLERIKRIEIQQLRLQKQKSKITASKKFRKLIFGNDNPYGKIITEDNFENLSEQDIKGFYEENLQHIEILISGKVNEGIIQSVHSFFAKKPTAPLTSLKKYPLDDNHWLIKESKEDAVQSSIRVGQPVVNKAHSDYIPLLITCHVLGGYFGSRLMKNIREDKGYTYGIHASIVTLQHQAYFVIGTDIKKEVTDETLSEINREIDLLINTPISSRELNTVKNHMLGHFQSHLSSAFSLAEKFKDIHIHQLDYSYYDHYLLKISSITADEIQDMARKYLSTDLMKKVIIG